MPSIRATNLTIEFPIYSVYMRSLRHQFGLGRIANSLGRTKASRSVGGRIEKGRAGKTVIKALNNVNFECHEGDRIGLLGRNGSGKSTLLRTIAGIYEPIGGELVVQGRVIPLFDMQLGMDQDATGLENIRLRGRMLDLTDKEIRDSLEDVAEFTQLGDYLYMPIRTYSAGMAVRLGFGISTAVAPDILILDEMIATGDAAFFERAQARLQRFITKAGILVIATHNNSLLKGWCNKGMVLDQGRLVMLGSVDEAIEQYNAIAASQAAPASDGKDEVRRETALAVPGPVVPAGE